MPLDTFSGIQAHIVSTAMRTGDTEFTAAVLNFITLFETRVNRSLRVGAMEKTAVLTPNASGAITLPADYLEFRSVQPTTAGYGPMELVAPDFQVGRYDGSGVPQRFSIAGSTLQTYPNANGAVRVVYFAKIPPLSDAAPTNWLLAAAPDLYLYGSLLEAAPYMEEDARAQVWKTYYDTAMADLKASDVSARYANGRARVRGATP